MLSNIEKCGLILEGGGLRGVYTSGVLHFFMEKRLFFPYVIGVSMGACNAASYMSRQTIRNRIINIRYITDYRYLSYIRLLFKGELFGMDFIFKTIPNTLVPFDYKTFRENNAQCIVVVTDCITGEALYFEKKTLGDEYLKILQASCSLPFISKPVYHNSHPLMDGGLSDPVPLMKSMHDENKMNVLVLTRPKGYRKKQNSFIFLARAMYPKFKGLYESMRDRHLRYNRIMDLIDSLEGKGEIFTIRPEGSLKAGRIERSKKVLYDTYDQGYHDALRRYDKLIFYLENSKIK